MKRAPVLRPLTRMIAIASLGLTPILVGCGGEEATSSGDGGSGATGGTGGSGAGGIGATGGGGSGATGGGGSGGSATGGGGAGGSSTGGGGAGGSATGGGGTGGSGATGGGGVGASGAGGSGGTGGGSGGSGGSGDPIADCEAVLDARSAKCQSKGLDNVACFYQEYKLFCTTGEPEAMVASMACFPPDVCWSFVDSNSAEPCLIESFVAHAKPKATAVNEAICAKCPGAPDPTACDGTATAIVTEHLPDDLLDTILACVEAATTCQEAVYCPSTSVPALVACF